MSRRAPRPDPLARLVRRSDRRCVLAAAWFVYVGGLHLAGLRVEDQVFEGAAVEAATVDDGYRPGTGDLTVPVRIGDRDVETRPVRDAPLPAPGADVEVEVATGQPGVVRLAGTSYAPVANVALLVGPLAVCGVLAVGRRRLVRAAQRRAARDEPTFTLVGVLRPAPLSRRRCQLDLYGLDAAVGSPPLVSVPLASSGEVPLEQPVTVWCKGVPRPFSLLVTRVGDAVLWPSAPAVGARRRPGRPAGLLEPTPLPASAPRSVVLRSLYTRPAVLAAGAGLVLLAAVAGGVSWGAARDRDRVATWPRAEATVLGSGPGECAVEVVYRAGGDEQRVAVTTGDCEAHPAGPGYLVLVDPDDPQHAILLSSRYDPWRPLGLAALGAFVACWWGAGAVDQHRRVRAAAAGPWKSVVFDGPAGPGSVAGPLDAVSAARCYVGDIVGSVAREVAVAGDVSPGATFVADHRGTSPAEELRGWSRAGWSSFFTR